MTKPMFFNQSQLLLDQVFEHAVQVSMEVFFKKINISKDDPMEPITQLIPRDLDLLEIVDIHKLGYIEYMGHLITPTVDSYNVTIDGTFYSSNCITNVRKFIRRKSLHNSIIKYANRSEKNQ